jgi:hypothetical protein
MNEQALYDLVRELRRLNDAIEMLFGLPDVGRAGEYPLVREIQKVIDEDVELTQRGGIWAMADNMGQAYLCVRSGFMQPPTCFAVNNVEDAKDYLGGVKKGARAR